MGTRDNKLEERGLPRDSCLLLSAPTRGYGDTNQLYEKNNALRCFSHIIDECPHLEPFVF
jgi:hypothetical protein